MGGAVGVAVILLVRALLTCAGDKDESGGVLDLTLNSGVDVGTELIDFAVAAHEIVDGSGACGALCLKESLRLHNRLHLVKGSLVYRKGVVNRLVGANRLNSPLCAAC